MMKKRLTSILLAAALVCSMLPAFSLPAAAADAGKSEITEATYEALGFSLDAGIAADQYFGPGRTTLYTKNELYFNLNGSSNSGWLVRDNLKLNNNWNGTEKAGAYELYGQFKNGDWANLKPKYGYNKGSTDGDKSVLASGLSSNNKHMGRAYAASTAYKSASGKEDRAAQLYVTVGMERKDYHVYLEITAFNGDTPYRLHQVDLGHPEALEENMTWNNEDFDALFEVTSGDYDGDGVDEVAVYYADNEVKIFKTADDKLEQWGEAIEVAPSDRTFANESGGTTNRAAVVALASGDLKKDHSDDLVVAVSMPKLQGTLTEVQNDLSKGAVYIYGYDREKEELTLDYTQELPHSTSGLGSTTWQAVNVAVGDLSGDGVQELVIAGYETTYRGNNYLLTGGTRSTIGTYHVTYDHSASDYITSDVQKFATQNTSTAEDSPDTANHGNPDGKTDEKSGTMDQGSTRYYSPVALGIADLNGLSNNSSYSGGYLLLYEQLYTRNQFQFEPVADGGMVFMKNELRDNANDRQDKSSFWVSDVIVGNFDGNDAGREQVLAVIGAKQKDAESYWYQIAYFSMDETGNLYSSCEGVINQATSYLNRTDKARASCYVTIATPDVDDDSLLLDFQGVETVYTKPEVQAVLQSAPYFQDVEDSYGYLSNGATAYGKSSSIGGGVSGGVSASVGVYTSVEVSLFGAGEFEAEVSASTSYEHSTNWDKTIEVEYSGSAGDDYVVMYTIPYYKYYYKALNPETKEWFDMVIEEPLTPATVPVAVDQYDAIAEQTLGLEPIRGNLLTSTPGDPYTYTTPPGSGKFKRIGETQLLTSGGAALVTVSQEETTSHEDGFTVGVEEAFKVGGGGGFLGNNALVGVVGSMGVETGAVVSYMNGVTYTGSVDSMPAEAAGYSCNWDFGISESKLNGESVMVVGYRTSNVRSRPTSPKNLSISDVTSNSMTLEWDATADASYYELWMARGNNSANKMAEVPSTAASNGVVTFTKTGLIANTDYTFTVCAVTPAGAPSLDSMEAKGTTLPDSMDGSFEITVQPQSQNAYAGSTASFTTNAATNTGSAIYYQWQRYDPDQRVWKNLRVSGRTLSVTADESTDGAVYRCRVYLDSGVAIYTQTATLTVGKTKSTTELTVADTDGNNLSEAVVKATTTTIKTDEGELVDTWQAVTSSTEDGKAYILMAMPGNDYDADAEKYSYAAPYVWMDSSGKYYTASETDTAFDSSKNTPITVTGTYEFSYAVTEPPTEEGGEPSTKVEQLTTSTELTGNLDSVTISDGVTSTSGYLVNGKEGDNAEYVYVVKTKDEDNEDITKYYYKLSDNTFAEASLTGTSGSFTLDNSETAYSTDNLVQFMRKTISTTGGSTTTETTPGDTLTLTATTDGKGDGDVRFQIVNQTTGSTESVNGKYDEASDCWTAECVLSEPGVYTVIAIYSGSDRYEPSTSDPVTLYAVGSGKTLSIQGGGITYGDSLSLSPILLESGDTSTQKPAVDVTYEVKKSGAEGGIDGLITGDTFKPDSAGAYIIKATYEGTGGESLAATAAATVYPRMLTITPEDQEATINSELSTRTLSAKVEGAASGDMILNTYYKLASGGTTATAQGKYPINVALTEAGAAALADKYTVVLRSGTYTLTETGHKVTATAGPNGAIAITYTPPVQEGQQANTLPLSSGVSAPEGSNVTFTATPDAGYQVSQWTVNGQVVTDGGASFKESTYTVENLKKEFTVSVEFKLSKNKLTFSASPAEGGTVTGAYVGASSGTFTSGSSVNYNQSVRLTAVPAEGYAISSWSVTRGNETEILKAADGASNYTGETYDFSHFTSDVEVVVAFVETNDLSVTIQPVGNDGKPLSNASVTVNGTALNAVEGVYTYQGHTGENLTITVTPPAGVMAESWTVGEGQTMPGSLSDQNQTMTIYNLTEKVDFTVKCTALNQYAVSFGGEMTDGTAINESAGTVTAVKLDAGTIPSGEQQYQGSTLIFTAQAKEGFEIVGWTLNGSPVNATHEDDGTQTYQIPALSSAANVVVTFRAQPSITFTAGANGSLTAGDKTTGCYVEYGSTEPITFTAEPAYGYEVDTWTVGEETLADVTGTPTPGSDDQTYVYTPGEGGIQSDVTVHVTFEEIPHVTVTYSVVDTTPGTDGGTNGTLTASVNRKGMDGYKVEDNGSGTLTVYRDSTVTFTPAPDEGYKVGQWFLNGTEVDAKPELTIDADTSMPQDVQVRFDPIGQAITYGFAADGATDKAQLSAQFLASGAAESQGFESGAIPATSGKLTVTVSELADGYEISGWSVNGEPVVGESGSTFVYSVQADTGADIRVKILRSSYPVAFTAENGTVTAAVGDTPLQSGDAVPGDTEVAFTAAPVSLTGYTFAGWMVNGQPIEETGETLTLSITEDTDVHAAYMLDEVTYSVTYGVIGEQGTLSAAGLGESPSQGTAGSSITFTAEPEAGYQVKGWYSDEEGTIPIGGGLAEQLSYTIDSLTADASVYVAFEPVPVYEITVTSTGNGAVTAAVNNAPAELNAGKLQVSRHDSVVLTAAPDAYSYLVGWTLDGAEQGNSLTLTLSDVTGAHTVAAAFAASQRVAFQAQVVNGNGTLTAEAGYGEDLQTIDASKGLQLETGKKVVLTAGPAENCMVKEWKIDGEVQENLSNTLTIENLQKNTAVTVEFETLALFTIPESTENYTVEGVEKTPADYGGDKQIRKGGSVTFTVEPKTGYFLTELAVNGLAASGTTEKDEPLTITGNGDGSFTITVKNVAQDITLAAKALQFKVEKDPLNEIPEELKEIYETPDALQAALRLAVTKQDGKVPAANMALYDIALQYTTDGGITWETATPEHFPAGGITVKLLYSELGTTDSSYDFTVIHMFTTSMNGHEPGETESITPTKEADGIRFTVTSLSPFAIGWSKKTDGTEGGGGGSPAASYTVTATSGPGGVITPSGVQTVAAGDQVRFTITPEQGYVVSDVLVDGKSVGAVRFYVFQDVQADHTISVTFGAACDGGGDCPSRRFTDVDLSLWYHEAMDYVLTYGLFQGTGETTFAPDATMTRGMLVTVLYRLEGEPAVDTAADFSDVKATGYYAKPVNWAAANKIVGGYEGKFKPEDPVTRQEMAAILHRYAAYKAYDVSETASLDSFRDGGETSGWAVGDVKWAVGAGMLCGRENSTLAPGGTATRAEVAQIMMRFREKFVRE